MYTNELINQTSPYLLQHAHNPVNWYPWGDEAHSKALAENKLMIISIGYSSCHWCHVMEHESFEDTTVAKIMNQHYVSIKVDREERPDVDQVYMDAAYALTGRGGWPLNVIALPDGRPIYAGTYFPKDDWLKVLNYFSDLFIKQPEKVEQEAAKITKVLRQQRIPGVDDADTLFSQDDINNAFSNAVSRIDFNNGGTNRAPKFPLPNIYEFFLSFNYHTKETKALNAVTSLLDNMAKGGIYDQIGGGFARYSTDDVWKVPHFEKMLYDNGQLISLYSNAYKVTGKQRYKQVVYQTLEFIQREMTDSSGGFYSSYDADSEGEEGKFYVWSKDEIISLLDEDGQLFCDYFTVTEDGNWEKGQNILFRIDDIDDLLEEYEIDKKTLDDKIFKAKQILFKQREKRIKPGLDDKILTSWNALMLKGFTDAYNTFSEEKFLVAAIKNAQFISSEMMDENARLYRNFKNGDRSINGFLDDYSFTIEAFIALYESTFDEQWLYNAKKLTDYVIKHFKDEKSGLFYYTSDLDDSLITRKMELSDNVIPASNSSLAKGLFKLANYFYKKDYKDIAKNMLSMMKTNFLSNPLYHSNWGILMSDFVYPYYEIAIVGEDFDTKRVEFVKKFRPNILLLGGKDEGTLELLEQKLVQNKTMIYVCEDKNCKLPVEDVTAAEEQLQ
ncbi:MAG: thioredoxin domain-containing protein [Bacteroidetes bacterium]|nr:thioredoxin domain-containing protein [Bacteroidota bacterium]